MPETYLNEVRNHDEEIRRLRETTSTESSQAPSDDARELLLPATRKAENTRPKERISRIGLILGNAIVEPRPTEGDEFKEMMRVAVELGDRDIEFFGGLTRIARPILQTRDRMSRYDAQTVWEQGFWGIRVDPEIDSVFSKLESYGRVARIPPPNNLNITADSQNFYVLLKRVWWHLVSLPFAKAEWHAAIRSSRLVKALEFEIDPLPGFRYLACCRTHAHASQPPVLPGSAWGVYPSCISPHGGLETVMWAWATATLGDNAARCAAVDACRIGRAARKQDQEKAGRERGA